MKNNIRQKSYKRSKQLNTQDDVCNKTIAQQNEIKQLAAEINKQLQFFRILKG